MSIKRLSLLEYAKKRGVSEQRVRKLVNQGKLSSRKIKGRLTVDPVTADREWSDNVNGKFSPRSKHAVPQVSTVLSPSELENDDDKKSQSDFADIIDSDELVEISKGNATEIRQIAEAKKEFWKARREKLDYEEKNNTLIAVDKVEHIAFETGRIVRDSILMIPDKISANLVGIKDQATVHILLMKELTFALNELERGIKKLNISDGSLRRIEAGPVVDGE